MLGLMGKKLGMTQIFTAEGDVVPATAVLVGPCTVVQIKTKESDGYEALQLGFAPRRAKGVPKARRGHCEKRSLPIFTHLKEFKTERVSEFQVGQELLAAGFKVGDTVEVSGVTKGRGFQGVMKRHGKHGGPAAHGSDFHRRPGSIGMRTWPGHVLKNMKLPGHMGDVAITTKNLKVVAVRPEDNVLLISGALPGARNGLLVVVPRAKDFETRPELKARGAQAPAESSGEASY